MYLFHRSFGFICFIYCFEFFPQTTQIYKFLLKYGIKRLFFGVKYISLSLNNRMVV